MNIYLDIDEVLLKKDGTVADHLEEFLDFMLKNHEVFWLTTHCRGGENRAVEHITSKNSVSEKTLALLEKIKPTNWELWKTEAINFNEDFLWLDDYIFDGEREILKKNNSSQKLIEIDLKNNHDQLLEIIL